MSVSASQLAYLPPQEDNQAFLDWVGFHAQAHEQVAAKAVRDGKTNLGTFDVADVGDFNEWLYWHAQEHIEIAQSYNLQAPPDLTYWDRSDPINDANWLQSHALVHDNEHKGLAL